MNVDVPRPVPDRERNVTVSLSHVTLASLQLFAAEVRYRSGTSLTSSAVVRALVGWLAEIDLDTRSIASVDDLRLALAGGGAAETADRAG